MSLFKTARLSFRDKTASASRLLGDNPEMWPNELLSMLYSQHQYLGHYTVDLDISARDDSTGYIYGSFNISQPQQPVMSAEGNQASFGSDPMADSQASNGPVMPTEPEMVVKIPVIAERRKVYPIDVMTDPQGGFLPLSETRIDAILVQTSPMDVSEMPPNDSSGAGGFLPPISRTFGAGQTYEKQASLLAAVCAATPDRVKEAYLESVFRGEEGKELRWAVDNNPAFKRAIGTIYRTKEARVKAARAPISAAVFEKVGSAVLVHATTIAGYDPITTRLERHEMAGLPDSVLQDLHRDGVSIQSEDVPYQPDETDFDLVKQAGVYSVLSGEDMIEHTVVPDVYRVDGTRSRQKLAFGYGSFSLQREVAGAHLGPAELDPGEPTGFGAFMAPDGSAATEPVHIRSKISSGGRSWFVSDEAGRIEKVAALQRPMSSGKGLAVPEHWVFQPLGSELSVAEAPSRVKSAASLEDSLRRIDIQYDGATYNFKGGAVADLPADSRQWVKEAKAMLLLGHLGHGPEVVRQKLAQAKVKGKATTYCGGKPKQRKSAARSKTASAVAAISLIKEAAAMPDQASVDATLSLGLITQDSIDTYLSYLPDLEQAVRRLAEVVIAARLGLRQVPEAAAARAMTGLDTAITGLQALQVERQDPAQQ